MAGLFSCLKLLPTENKDSLFEPFQAFKPETRTVNIYDLAYVSYFRRVMLRLLYVLSGVITVVY